MKTLKKILTCLIISLAAFACVEKGFSPLFGHFLYVSENLNKETKSGNSITSDIDLPEVDITVMSDYQAFKLKHTLIDRVLISDPFCPQNPYFQIWQPPKIA